jgi:hypothetical protein
VQFFKTKVDNLNPHFFKLDIIRLVSLRGGSISAGFLQAIPKGRKDLQLLSSRFGSACALRLGCALPIVQPGLVCTSNVHREPTEIDTLGVHLSNCALNGLQTIKHNAVVSFFRDMASAAGIISQPEPECLGGRLRPDVRLKNDRGEGFVGLTDLLLDVTVQNPCAPTNIIKNVWRQTGGLASAAATEKINKYQVAVDACGLKFSPIVLETFGGVGKGTIDLVTMLARRISRASGIVLPVIKRFWLQRLSILLQDYNIWTIESRLEIVCVHKANGGTGRHSRRDGGADMYDDEVVIRNHGGRGDYYGDED